MKTSLDDHRYVVRMPDDIKTRLVQRSERDHSSMNSVILRALEQYLNEEPAYLAEMRDALAELRTAIHGEFHVQHS